MNMMRWIRHPIRDDIDGILGMKGKKIEASANRKTYPREVKTENSRGDVYI